MWLNWIDLAQNMNRWWALVNKVMNLRIKDEAQTALFKGPGRTAQ